MEENVDNVCKPLLCIIRLHVGIIALRLPKSRAWDEGLLSIYLGRGLAKGKWKEESSTGRCIIELHQKVGEGGCQGRMHWGYKHVHTLLQQMMENVEVTSLSIEHLNFIWMMDIQKTAKDKLSSLDMAGLCLFGALRIPWLHTALEAPVSIGLHQIEDAKDIQRDYPSETSRQNCVL